MNITILQLNAAIQRLKSDPRFVRFSPPLEQQINGIVTGIWGQKLMADFDVSGGCGQAFSPFIVNITE